jgi:hypothetical protein
VRPRNNKEIGTTEQRYDGRGHDVRSREPESLAHRPDIAFNEGTDEVAAQAGNQTDKGHQDASTRCRRTWVDHGRSGKPDTHVRRESIVTNALVTGFGIGSQHPTPMIMRPRTSRERTLRHVAAKLQSELVQETRA